MVRSHADMQAEALLTARNVAIQSEAGISWFPNDPLVTGSRNIAQNLVKRTIAFENEYHVLQGGQMLSVGRGVWIDAVEPIRLHHQDALLREFLLIRHGERTNAASSQYRALDFETLGTRLAVHANAVCGRTGTGSPA